MRVLEPQMNFPALFPTAAQDLGPGSVLGKLLSVMKIQVWFYFEGKKGLECMSFPLESLCLVEAHFR